MINSMTPEEIRQMRSPILIEMDYFAMFVLIGNVQLALRHQEHVGPSSTIAKTLAREMAERIMTDLDVITPEVLAAYRMG